MARIGGAPLRGRGAVGPGPARIAGTSVTIGSVGASAVRARRRRPIFILLLARPRMWRLVRLHAPTVLAAGDCAGIAALERGVPIAIATDQLIYARGATVDRFD